MLRPSLLAAGALVCALPLGAQAPAPPRLELRQYLDFEEVRAPRLSPDGRQLVYTRRHIDQLKDRWESALWIMDADGGRQRFLARGSDARWSPDGTRLAYVAEGEPKGAQVFVLHVGTDGPPTQVTRVSETPADLQWSPDGTRLAFRMSVPDEPDWSVPLPAAPAGAQWTAPPKVVQKPVFRRDREGFTDTGYRHLFVVPATGGTPRQITRGDHEHGAPRWTPDGTALVFSALREEDAPWRWRESEVYRVEVATGVVTQLTRRRGPDANPVPSPDGRWIAYTGLDSTDATWADQKLYVMRADGSEVRELSGGMDRTPLDLIWAADNSGIYFGAESEGSRNLHFVSLAGGAPRAVTSGVHMLVVDDIAPTGLAVGTRSSFQAPYDVVRFTVRKPAEITRLTAVNDDLLAGRALGAAQELWYTSVDGFRIQGWLITPPQFDPKKKYPLMLSIHGGPHSMYNVAFNFAWQEHAANDYLVLYTNPRGSTGYGSAFGNAIKNAYPGKDYDDLMAGVDEVIRRGIVDTDRMYVYGCSGGGVLTSWIVGQTDRFAAASANCPVTNWLSFVGTTDGLGWYNNFEKLPWEDPSEHLRRSPLMHVGKVTTPTMLMTGVLDLRTPMGQTEEYYQALQRLKVPSAMVRFNDEWHGTSSKPSNWLRTQAYLRGWFTRWTKAKPAAVRWEAGGGVGGQAGEAVP